MDASRSGDISSHAPNQVCGGFAEGARLRDIARARTDSELRKWLAKQIHRSAASPDGRVRATVILRSPLRIM